jgi:hypothetical protein
MGEAQRSKQAGTYPEQSHVEDWRVPNGTVAITLDVAGCDPSTFAIDASELVGTMERAAPPFSRAPYHTAVRWIAQEFPKVRGADEGQCKAIGIAALWSALHHPTCGEKMREAVSASLRRNGRAHISWCFGPNGLAMALAESFRDLETIAASYAASGGGVAVVEAVRDAETMQ